MQQRAVAVVRTARTSCLKV